MTRLKWLLVVVMLLLSAELVMRLLEHRLLRVAACLPSRPTLTLTLEVQWQEY